MRMRARAVTSRNWEPVTVVAPPRKWISIRAVSQDGCGGAAGATLREVATTSHWWMNLVATGSRAEHAGADVGLYDAATGGGASEWILRSFHRGIRRDGRRHWLATRRALHPATGEEPRRPRGSPSGLFRACLEPLEHLRGPRIWVLWGAQPDVVRAPPARAGRVAADRGAPGNLGSLHGPGRLRAGKPGRGHPARGAPPVAPRDPRCPSDRRRAPPSTSLHAIRGRSTRAAPSPRPDAPDGRRG